jgi:hypothetical protein
MRAVVYFKYNIYCPEEVTKSANSSVGLLLWSEQTISHWASQFSYFMLLYQMRKYLPSVPGEIEEIDQECDLTASSLPSEPTCPADSGRSHFPKW